ncbi:hypothetical protein [Arthrobacter sp. UYCo732]|uniref:hypothetical protein n=1 Tax=Arthrobacter sp. UYCo732 TaxID=3156336 RepID=UPI003395CF79
MERTIPAEAWEHVGNSVFRDGHLYPDLSRIVNGLTVYQDSDDEQIIHWLSHFTVDNYAEWAGAAIVCPRAPSLEETLFRFDDVGRFIAHGYRNPFRAAGEPDWYFFWTRNHPMGVLKKWARSAGIIPAKDLPRGAGGYGIDTGLRAATPSH